MPSVRVIALMFKVERLPLLKRAVARDELKDHQGFGKFTSQRGWWLLGRWWIPHDPPEQEAQ